MFEGVVAYLLNKYLGKYVRDLNAENLNVGIFSGTVQLTDLHLKPEALFELDLPIEVVGGSIGKVSIDIPWTSLKSEPVLIHIEDILILSSPIGNSQNFEPNQLIADPTRRIRLIAEIERKLLRAKKSKILKDAKTGSPQANQSSGLFGDIPPEESRGFFEDLIATVINNVQISIQNVHIRYEDLITNGDGTAVCAGIAFKCLTAISTNSKWKAKQLGADANNIFKLLKLETMYVYWNPNVEKHDLVRREFELSSDWLLLMKTSIFNCSIHRREFDFVLKPIVIKLKLILNKTQELQVPKLLADCVLQDAVVEMSKNQFKSILEVRATFERLEVNRRYIAHRPLISIRTILKVEPSKASECTKSWWRYAYNSIKEEYLNPNSWLAIKNHRIRYRAYRDLFLEHLKNPMDAELRVDLLMAEDALDITSTLLAQEEAKIQLMRKLINEQPDLINNFLADEIDFNEHGSSASSKYSSPLWFFGCEELLVKASEQNLMPISKLLDAKSSEHDNLWTKLNSDEKTYICEAIDRFATKSDSKSSSDQPDQSRSTDSKSTVNDNYIAHKINVTLTNLTLSLTDCGIESANSSQLEREILVVNLNQLLASLETRPTIKSFKSSLRAETLIVEGLAGNYDLIPIITADQSLIGSQLGDQQSVNQHKTYVFALDIEKNPRNLNPDINYAISGQVDPIEILYQHTAFNELIQFFNPVSKILRKPKPDLGKMVANVIKSAATISKESLVKLDPRVHLDFEVKSPCLVLPELGAIELGGRVLMIDFGRLTIKSSDANHNKDVLSPESSSSGLQEDGDEVDENRIKLNPVQINFSDVQVLFSDNGDEWRAAKELPESDLHIIPRLNVQMVYSKTNQRQFTNCDQSKHKLNIAIGAIKLNLSDRRLRLLQDFLMKTPIFGLNQVLNRNEHPDDVIDASEPNQDELDDCVHLDKKFALVEPDVEELRRIRSVLNLIASRAITKNFDHRDSCSTPSMSKSCSTSETWFTAPEQFVVKPDLAITKQFSARLLIGEILIHLSRSSDVIDKAYLMARFEKLQVDLNWIKGHDVIKEVTIGLRGMLLVDKQHASPNGGYLELIKTPLIAGQDLIGFNCKVTKSKTGTGFTNHSITLNIGTAVIHFHRDSLITISRYLSYVVDSVPSEIMVPIKDQVDCLIRSPSLMALADITASRSTGFTDCGSKEWALSGRVTSLSVLLCETDAELSLITIKGLETGFSKSGSDVKLRLDLNNLLIVDEGEESLYPDILTTISEPLINVEFANCSSGTELTNGANYELDLKVGKVRFIFLRKFVSELLEFFEPFKRTKELISDEINEELVEMEQLTERIKFNLVLDCPILMFPQKVNSPNLVIVEMDQVLIANSFEIAESDLLNPVLGKLLIELVNCRAKRSIFMMGDDVPSSTIIDANQRQLIEPFTIKASLTQQLAKCSSMNLQLSVDVADRIRLNCGQTDLAVLIAISQENLANKPQSSDHHPATNCDLLNSDSKSLIESQDDDVIDALIVGQDNLERFRLIAVTVKEMQLRLIREDLDVHPELCSIKLTNSGLSVDDAISGALEVKTTINSIKIVDHRGGSNLQAINEKVASSPSLDITIKLIANQEPRINFNVEQLRLGLSFGLIVELMRFFDHGGVNCDNLAASVSGLSDVVRCSCSKLCSKSNLLFGKRSVKQ